MGGEGEIKNLPARVVAEFTGTFLLIFTVGCNVLSETPVWAGVSIACVLMVVIYAFGGISGANFNPAVSVMLGIVESMKEGSGMPWKEVGIYCGVQIAAGILAGFSYFALFGHTFNLAPAKGFGWLSAGLCELFYTFMLTFVVANVAVTKDEDVAGKKDADGNQKGNDYYGLAIGFSVVAGAYGEVRSLVDVSIQLLPLALMCRACTSVLVGVFYTWRSSLLVALWRQFSTKLSALVTSASAIKRHWYQSLQANSSERSCWFLQLD